MKKKKKYIVKRNRYQSDGYMFEESIGGISLMV